MSLLDIWLFDHKGIKPIGKVVCCSFGLIGISLIFFGLFSGELGIWDNPTKADYFISVLVCVAGTILSFFSVEIYLSWSSGLQVINYQIKSDGRRS